MEFQMFHNNIKQIMQEAELLIISIMNLKHIEKLRDLMTLLGEIEIFFCETQNIGVLEEY